MAASFRQSKKLRDAPSAAACWPQHAAPDGRPPLRRGPIPALRDHRDPRSDRQRPRLPCSRHRKPPREQTFPACATQTPKGGSTSHTERKKPNSSVKQIDRLRQFHYSRPNANRAPHRRPSLPIPPRGWRTPRPPAWRRGAERHCPRHHPRRYPAAPTRAANRPSPPRGARSATPHARTGACSAPATRRSPRPAGSTAPARSFARRPPSPPPCGREPPRISQPGRQALHPGGIPPTQP